MKCIRLHGTGNLQLHDEPVPIAGAGQRLVRIRSVGVCGSDVHWFSEGSIGDAKLDRPLVLGHEPEVGIPALSENVVTLLATQQTDTGFLFAWQNFNPTKFPLKTHIGMPPVIGTHGIIYGLYETLDIAEIPITPANARVAWTTEVEVPSQVDGFYILLSVESKKPRTYVNYAVEISDR